MGCRRETKRLSWRGGWVLCWGTIPSWAPRSPSIRWRQCCAESVCIFLVSNGDGEQLQGSQGEKVSGFFFLFGYIILEASSHPVTQLQETIRGTLLFEKPPTSLGFLGALWLTEPARTFQSVGLSGPVGQGALVTAEHLSQACACGCSYGSHRSILEVGDEGFMTQLLHCPALYTPCLWKYSQSFVVVSLKTEEACSSLGVCQKDFPTHSFSAEF